MPLRAGDKCPQCKVGMLERTAIGLTCTSCPYDLEISEVVEANKKERTTVVTNGGEYKFKGALLRITIDDPDKAEEFIRGLILARQNNNSEYFPELIDGVNEILQPWRAERLRAEVAARG